MSTSFSFINEMRVFALFIILRFLITFTNFRQCDVLSKLYVSLNILISIPLYATKAVQNFYIRQWLRIIKIRNNEFKVRVTLC